MKDLFLHREDLPSDVEDVVLKYEDMESLSKEDIIQFEEELKVYGYTFDWGLDLVPFNLQKTTTIL